MQTLWSPLSPGYSHMENLPVIYLNGVPVGSQSKRHLISACLEVRPASKAWITSLVRSFANIRTEKMTLS